MQNSRIIMQLVFLSLLSSKRSSGPVNHRTSNPRGGFPQFRGLPDFDSFVQLAGALSPGAPGMPISPKLAPTNIPGVTRRIPASTGRILPNTLCAFTHNHASTKYVWAFTVPLLYSSGLSPYHCSTRNRTIHHQGSTWISLTIHRTQSPQHLYIDSHNTLYFLYNLPCVSLKTAATTELPQEALCHFTHTRLTSPRQRMQTS